MIRHYLIRKYFFLAVTIVVLFVVLGFFISNLIAQSLRNDDISHNIKPERIPPLFIAKIVDHLQAQNKVQALQLLDGWQKDGRAPALTLLDQQGNVIYTSARGGERVNQIDVAQLTSLKNEYDYIYIPNLKKNKVATTNQAISESKNGETHPSFFERLTRFDFIWRVGPPPPPPDFHADFRGSPPPPGGPPFQNINGGPPIFEQEDDLVVKLSGKPEQYLLIQHPAFDLKTLKEPGQFLRPKKPLLPFLGVGSLFLSLLIGIGVTLFIISVSVFKKLKEADHVISELHSGNLKARFKINRKDEFGEAMLRFNKMADEIQNLVEHLQFVEEARTKLLQELAHDLRTPIASLKGLLETLETKNDKLKPEIRQEILELSSREVDYFERLVEDLLLLSQVSEPKYNFEDHKQISIQSLVSDQIEDFKILHKQDLKKINYQNPSPGLDTKIYGDEHLFKRMIINILNNAFVFSKTEINISMKEIDTKTYELIFEDDGVGFTEQQLLAYGHRKMSRQYITSKNSQKRLSVGLGSVIIKKIAQIHRGEVQASNRIDADGNVCGARIKIVFKL